MRSDETEVLDMTDDLDDLGPIDYLVVEFPGAQLRGEALPILLDPGRPRHRPDPRPRLLRKDPDGSVVVLEISDLDGDGVLDVEVLRGASSGVLGRDDIEEAAALVQPGSAAGIVIYENLWAAPFVAALHRAGAELVAAGRVGRVALLPAWLPTAQGVWCPRRWPGVCASDPVSWLVVQGQSAP